MTCGEGNFILVRCVSNGHYLLQNVKSASIIYQEISPPDMALFPMPIFYTKVGERGHSVSCFPIRISLPVPGFLPVHVCEGTRLFFDQEIEVIIFFSE